MESISILWTTLHLNGLVFTDVVPVVEFLVSEGANIHAEYDRPLRHASSNGHLDVVKFLVSKGADVRAVGNYAYRIAKEEGRIDCS